MKRLLVMLLVLAGCTQQPPVQTDPSLASLRQVDDLPLYEMTYVGDYDELAGVNEKAPSPFGCSLFVASGDPARPLFARNFDWDPNPALVLHTDPPDGHASISMVDISCLGVTSSTNLLGDPEAKRKLLKAPLLPFDGMNERGLAVGLAADEIRARRSRPGQADRWQCAHSAADPGSGLQCGRSTCGAREVQPRLRRRAGIALPVRRRGRSKRGGGVR